MKSHPEFDLQGHRGARGILPENTIPSLIKALEYSVTTLEFDIVVSADSQLVLSHEPWFHHHIGSHPDGRAVTQDEATSLNMFQMNYDEIRRYDVGLRGHINFPEQEPMAAIKPLMRDAIQQVEAHISEHGLEPVWYNIETKTLPEYYDVFTPQPDVFATLLYAELADLGVLDRVTVQSFDVNTLKAMRKIDKRVPLVLLIYNENGLEWNLEQLGFIPEIYSPYFRYVDKNLVSEVHNLNMKLIPWTVNNQEDMLRLIHLGVDGLITDYPNRAIALPEICERLGFPPSEG
ncbi:MAG: hypothetical protein LAT52_10000 [Balneolales bacterium]|nr:hypothetical protein [Balneolales bacterium]